MTRGICCAVAVVAMGCVGSDAPSPQERLIGTWALERADGCVLGFVFEDDGSFEVDFVCELNTGEIGLEVVVGTYEVDGDRILLRAEASSCPVQDRDSEARFDFTDAGDLRIIDPSGALVLQRLPQGTGGDRGLIVLFGCYEDDGSFEQREIQEL